jgi:DNA-binding response OmpR family regulator
MKNILIIETDGLFAGELATRLRQQGLNVELAADGALGLQMMGENNYDFVLLDFDAPQLSGPKLCRLHRAAEGSTAIIVLSSLHFDCERPVQSLDAGADDFLWKPFEMRELLARMRAILRRPRKQSVSESTAIESVRIDPASKAVRRGERFVRLSDSEFEIIDRLFQNPNTVFSSLQLSEARERGGSDDAVRQRMRTLRRKLTYINAGDLIKTIPHAGYVVATL